MAGHFVSAGQASQDLTIVMKTFPPWLETLPSRLKDHQVCCVMFWREGGREGGVNVPHLIASFRMRQTLWVIARHLVLSEALVGMNKLDLSFGEKETGIQELNSGLSYTSQVD